MLRGPVTQGADRAHGGGGGDVGEGQHEVARRAVSMTTQILTRARHLRQDSREQEEEGVRCRW